MRQPNKDYVKCPFTGEMIPRKVTIDAVSEGVNIKLELKVMREEWQAIGPVKRSGAVGNKLMGDYRRLAHKHWEVHGVHAPPIYSEG